MHSFSEGRIFLRHFKLENYTTPEFSNAERSFHDCATLASNGQFHAHILMNVEPLRYPIP